MDGLTLTTINSNCHTVNILRTLVLFSYGKPVAAFVEGEGAYITDQHWSATTSRHIKAFIRNSIPVRLPQEVFDSGDIYLRRVLREEARTQQEQHRAKVTAALRGED